MISQGPERRYPGELTQSRQEYNQREEAVYRRGEPSCKKAGPEKAKCILPPGHGGDWHEGNGFDEWGPKYWCWSDQRRPYAHNDGDGRAD